VNSARPALSIIIPVFDEAANIIAALEALAPLRARGAEVIVADGGSRDDTVALAQPLADRVIAAPRGRASQMNAGAAVARGDAFLFLHADTQLPADPDRLILDGLARSGRAWGRFDVTIDGTHSLFPAIALFMNARSRLTGIMTGDQAMFVTRNAFAAVGGFPAIALMEDITLARNLKRVSRPLCLSARVTTSGRRWEKRGVVRTVLLMWRLRLMYFFGATPEELARRYGYGLIPPPKGEGGSERAQRSEETGGVRSQK
jgi:rSAM/selenodomain-associated transferase 2